MCGVKPCSSCDKISGTMKRRRKSYKSKKLLSKSFIEQAVVGGIGFVAAGLVGRVIPSLTDNPSTDSYIKAAVKVAAGSFLATQKGSMTTAAGVGMATSGAVDLANGLGLTDTVNNLLPASTTVAGVRLNGIRRTRVGCRPTGAPQSIYAAAN